MEIKPMTIEINRFHLFVGILFNFLNFFHPSLAVIV